MNKYMLALLLCGIMGMVSCSLPVNNNPDSPEKKQIESSDRVQKAQDTKNGTQAKTPEIPQSTDKKVNKDTVAEKTYSKIRITLYYQDGDGMVIPVTRETDKQEGIARAAVTALVDSSISREELEYFGIYPVIPMGTEVIGLNIKQGTATVDFNNKFLEYKNAASEKNIIASVVYTLTEFKTIENVRILVNGRSQGELRFGTDISKPLSRQNILINAEKVNLQDARKKLDLYLFKSINKNMFALPISVESEAVNEEDVPVKIVSMLNQSFFDGKVQSQLPSGTSLIGSKMEGDTLILDFNAAFANYGGTAREDAILTQLQYSMKQIKGVGKIKILIEGKDVPLPEGTETSNGVAIPGGINFLDE